MCAERPASISSRLATALLATALGGCAGTVPLHHGYPPSLTWIAPSGSSTADVAARAGIRPDASAAWPLPQAAFALDARLSAIAQATQSIDVQAYLLADDGVGRLVLRELSQAASRGVRIRLLVDDLYTTGLDPLLLGLAAHPNVEVRVFNPFARGRASSLGRLIELAADFRRLDHRMHNKLLVVDGRLAIVGGRNLADDYFLRGKSGNFFDIDLLLIGAVVPSLSAFFDLYWNSEEVLDIHDIASGGAADADLKAAFDRRTSAEPIPSPPSHDRFGAEPFSVQIATGSFHFITLQATSVLADSPEKARAVRNPNADTVARRFAERLDEARQEVVIFSPYFVPDTRVTERLRSLRARGVSVRVVTNSLAVSDDPFVNIALERHQRELLAIGVELYELSSSRIRLDSSLRTLVGSTIGRLHAKMALIDRHVVYVGSMNLDARSAHINTEIGVRIESAEVAGMLIAAYRLDEAAAVYRVRLLEDGHTLAWSIVGADGSEATLDEEPDASWWQRLRARVLSVLLPEDEL